MDAIRDARVDGTAGWRCLRFCVGHKGDFHKRLFFLVGRTGEGRQQRSRYLARGLDPSDPSLVLARDGEGRSLDEPALGGP